MRIPVFAFALFAAALLAGCDMIGIESAEKTAAARDGDGKAIGGACRHAGRAIEDCYTLYKKADRAAIFAGWRDMNDYMRENKIEPVTPQLGPQTSMAKSADAKGADEVEKVAEPPKTAARQKAAEPPKAAARQQDAEPPKASAGQQDAKPADS